MKNVYTPVEQELARFFIAGKAFQKETNKPVFMPVCIVDEAWHSLMSDEVRYDNLTSSFVGTRIEHLQNKGFGEIEWVANYERMFGKLSKHWFTCADGKFNSTAYDEYIEKGKLYAAWDCTPGYQDKNEELTVISNAVAIC